MVCHLYPFHIQKSQIQGPYLKDFFFRFCAVFQNRGSDDSEKGPAGVSGDLILLRTPVSAADSASYDLVTA